MKLNRCDFALAVAPLWRRWGTALLVVLMLSVGLALTAVNLSLFRFLYVSPLPYENYDRLVWLGQDNPVQRNVAGDSQTLDNVLFLRRELTTVESVVAANRWHNETLRYKDRIESVYGTWVDYGYFEALGVKPILGSTFSHAALASGGPRPLILAERFWEERFNRNASILGEVLYLDDRPHVVVGVLGNATRDPASEAYEQPLYWAPLDPREVPRSDWRSRWFPAFALRKNGVTTAQLQAELDGATQRLREMYPEVMANRSLVAHPIKFRLFGERMKHFNLLMGVATLLSVLILVNLTNLLLARLADRRSYLELATALGASPIQMLKPLLFEHGVLVTLSVALALPLSIGYRHLLFAALQPTGILLPIVEPGYFVLTAAGLAAFVFALVLGGVWPQLQRSQARGAAAGGANRVVSSRSRNWVDGVAIFGQTALAIALLAVCSLLALSLFRQANANRDLRLVRLHHAFSVAPVKKYASAEAASRARFELKRALQEIPGVKRVAMTSDAVPNAQTAAYAFIDDLDTSPAAESVKRAPRLAVCPDYFDAAGLRVVAGRIFAESDMNSGRRLMVVSRRAAELYWPGRDPVGRRVLVNHRTDDWAEVIGVVEDIESPQTNERMPVLYRSFDWHPYPNMHYVIETQTGQPITRQVLQETFTRADPHRVLIAYDEVAEAQRRMRWFPEAIAEISFLLALVACGVAGLGLFSVLNRRVASSMRELAVRKALGAPSWRIVSSVGARDVSWATGGIALGIAVSLLGTQALFALGNLDAWDYVLAPSLASLGVLVGALLGALVPLTRALVADPLPLLRDQA